MNAELRERREKVFNQYSMAGGSYTLVRDQLADEYDVSPKMIERDMSTVSDRLPKLLDELPDREGTAKYIELQRNRQELHQLAQQARADGDAELELKIRRQIDKSTELALDVAERIGLLDDALIIELATGGTRRRRWALPGQTSCSRSSPATNHRAGRSPPRARRR